MHELQHLWKKLQIKKPSDIAHVEEGGTFMRFTYNKKQYEVIIQEVVKGEKKRVFWPDDDLG